MTLPVQLRTTPRPLQCRELIQMKTTSRVAEASDAAQSDRQVIAPTTLPASATRCSQRSGSGRLASLAAALSLAFAGCRTVSTIEPAGAASRVDLSRYDQAERDVTRFGAQAEVSPGSGKFGVFASYTHTKYDYDQTPVECQDVELFTGQAAFCPGGVQTPLPQSCAVFEALSTVTVPHWPLRGPPLTQNCPVSVG